MSNWQPIETAPKPKEYTPILAGGYHSRDGQWVMGIIYWHAHSEWREVKVGDNLYEKKLFDLGGNWRAADKADYRFEPEYWMPLPSPPYIEPA